MPKVSKQVQRRIAELDAQYTVAQPKHPGGFTVIRRVLAVIVFATVAVAAFSYAQSHHVRFCPAHPETRSCACHVGSGLTRDSKAASEVMDTLKGAALAFILCIGPCYAADKIALICSDAKGKDDYSLSIDLDRKLASFHMSDLPDADGIPITGVSENYIWFQYKALPGIYSQGKLDRITGSLHFFHRQLNSAKDYYLRCKPAKPFEGPAR